MAICVELAKKVPAARGFSILIAPMLVLGAAAPAFGSADLWSAQLGSYVRVTPSLSSRVEYDDNIFLTPNDKESDVITRIQPNFDIEIGAGEGALSVNYRPEFGVFADSQDDNIVNHFLSATYTLRGGRFDTALSAGYDIVHDARGTGPSNGLAGATQAVFDEPPRHEDYNLGISVGNAGRGARTRVVAAYEYFDSEYQNFRAITRSRDHDTNDWSIDLGYNVGGATYASVGVSLLDRDYDFVAPGDPDLDSKEYRYDAGFIWEASGLTTAHASIGWQEKDFEDSSLDDPSQFVWDIGFTWEPNSYSSVDVTTSSSFRETDREGTAVESMGIDLSHRVAWNDRFSTTTGFSYANEDFEGDRREDDLYSATVRVDYGFRRWLSLGAGFETETRSSNTSRGDYDRNLVFLQAQIGI